MVIRENDPRQDNLTTVECDYGIAERLFPNSREEGGKNEDIIMCRENSFIDCPCLVFFQGKNMVIKLLPQKIKPCFNKQPVRAIWSYCEGNEEISFL